MTETGKVDGSGGGGGRAGAPALTTPVWFAVGATWASVGSSCALLLPAFGSTPADVSPAPAHAEGAKAQQAASNRIRELFMVLW